MKSAKIQRAGNLQKYNHEEAKLLTSLKFT